MNSGSAARTCYACAMARLIVISGGQSGVDRAALDAAIACGMAYEGWCPQGGWAEDFPSRPACSARYPLLLQTPNKEPAQRTHWNVRDADACLILTDAGRHRGLARQQIGRARGGALRQAAAGPRYRRGRCGSAHARRRELLAPRGDVTPVHLAIGGPRESEVLGIYRKARVFAGVLFDDLLQAQEAAA